MSHTDHFSKLCIILFFKELIQTQLSADTATAIDPLLSDRGGSLCVLFVKLIHLYNYGVTYIQLTYFILSNILSNTILSLS